MAEMHFGEHHDPELEPKRARTLFISICIHGGLLLILILNPGIFVQTPKRIIRIAGQDYDLSKLQMMDLTSPQQPKPQAKAAAPEPPLQQPAQQEPPPQAAPPPPPPPPPPPQPKEMPPVTPDMTLADGAKLDGSPKPSQGNTAELKAGSSGNPDAGKPVPPKSEAQKSEPKQLALNTNPNALTLRDLAGKILQEQNAAEQKRYPNNQGPQGPRTGLPMPNVQESPDFSTEDPKILSPTYGYDFGPYLNQVLNRIRYNWYALIPEIAKFRKGKVVVIFRITKNGVIENTRVVANSGADPLDRAAYGSITGSNPFPRIPPDFSGDYLDLQITFLYNIR